MNCNHSVVCSRCSLPFSRTNLPRIAPCSHTYCEKCLDSYDHCSMDQEPYDLLTKTEELEINTAIMKLVEAKGEADGSKCKGSGLGKGVERCLLHDREIDLVCIDDRVGICTNCALFGEHKNHNIKTTDSVMEECALMAEQTIAILSEIEDMEATASVKALESRIDLAFKDKKQLLAKQIKAKFYKIIEAVRAAEKACFGDLDRELEQEKSVLKGLVSKSVEDEKKRSWIKEAEKLIQIVDSQKVDEAAKYLNQNCSENALIKKGQFLVMDLNARQKHICEQLAESLDRIIFEMNNTAIEAQLADCYKLRRGKELELMVIKTQRVVDDEFLLGEEEETYLPITPSPIVDRYVIDSNSNSMYIDIPELAIEKIGINVHSFIEKSQRKLIDRSMIKQPLGISTLDNKKRKKIKIPEKYESVFEDLRNDRLDCMDFTNAELGDAVLTQLTDYIKNSHKLRTIKLIRNKLTDECIIPLLDACREGKILSLNLGQNAFTDKVFDVLEKVELKDLRNLTLSQNKINQRSSKARIAEFKRKGLTISI